MDVGQIGFKSMKSIGTRIRSTRNKRTALETTRFYFEEVIETGLKSGFKNSFKSRKCASSSPSERSQPR